MISNVNSLLNFDSGCVPDREFFLIGQSGANGSFLLHHAIASSVKEGRGVCLLSLVQKFHHYNSVSQKVGVNLQTASSSNQVVFIDGLNVLAKTFCTDEMTDGRTATFLTRMKATILETLPVLRKDRTRDPVIVIDDVSILLSMGLHVDNVGKFVNSLVWDTMHLDTQGSETEDSSVRLGVSLVVLCSYLANDRDTLSLWKFLSHLSSVQVDVTGLQTGYCKDVHGQVCVVWKDRIDRPRRHQRKRLQFKLSDSGVDFFAAGMSSAVL